MKQFYFLMLVLSVFHAFGQQKHPIIDMHLHAFEVGGLFPAEMPTTGFMAPESTEALRREVLAALERNNVVLALTSGPLVDSYKGGATKIIEGCGLMGPDKVNNLRGQFDEDGCEALAEFAPQYNGLKPDHPSLEPYFAFAEQLDIPVGIHIGLGPPGAAYVGFKDYRMMDSNPLYLENVLINHPNLRQYVMHAGWPMLDEMIGLMYAHPQVYIDVAIINWGLPQKEFYYILNG